MNLTKKLIVATTVTGVLAVADIGTLKAADTSTVLKMVKPIQGAILDVGSKHTVSYFLSENGKCRLTLMIAELPYGNEASLLTAARFVVAIQPDESGRLDTAEGKSLEFTCNANAQAMSIKGLERDDALAAR